MTLGLTARLALCAVPPYLLVAALVAADQPAAALAAAAGSAVLVGFGVWQLTAPFRRLKMAAAEAARQAKPSATAPGVGDGTGDIAAAIGTLLDELGATRKTLADRDNQFAAALTHLADVTTAAAELKSPTPPAVSVRCPWPDKANRAAEAVNKAWAAHVQAARRAATLGGILNDLPAPVLVFNTKNELQYLNPAAEGLYPDAKGRSVGRPARDFFARPGPADADGPTPLGPDEVMAFVARPHGGECEAVAASADPAGTPVAVAVGSRVGRKSNLVPVVLRDLSSAKQSEAAARLSQRRALGRRLCLLIDKDARPALDAVRTHAGLLAQAAKQAGQRERFVPLVGRMLDDLGRQETILDQIGWLGRLTRLAGTSPDPVEMRVRAAVDEAVERTQAVGTDRGNTINVDGDAGWLLADEDWVAALFTGLLAHAHHASEKGTITVELRRRSLVSGRDEAAEVVVKYPGAALTADELADLKEPFGRPDTAVFDPAGRGGCLLGLAVAYRVATLMGGSFDAARGATEQTLRVALPTREVGAATAAVVAPVPDAVSSEDTLAGWFVGGGATALADDDQPSLSSTPAPVPVVTDETVGGWFGGGD